MIALAQRAGIVDGDRILDAGCGIGGPAAILAHRYPNARIDGVTNSVIQAGVARDELATAGLSERVVIHVADYQRLPFPSEVFDVVVFFESTGYATDIDQMYRRGREGPQAGRASLREGRLLPLRRSWGR